MIRQDISITICSNVILHPFDEFLEQELETLGVAIKVADFDSIWVEVESATSDFVFIHNDILNLTPDIAAKFIDKKYVGSLIDYLENRIFNLKQGLVKKKSPLIISTSMTGFSLALHNVNDGANAICCRYNKALLGVADVVIDFGRSFSIFGLRNSLSWPNFYRFTAPYKHDFLRHLAKQVATEVKRQMRGAKKVLVVDCDNTLWSGVIGEDSISGIKYDDSSPKGRCFNEIQKLISVLSSVGVLIAICSKNNYRDVADFFKHSSAPLTMEIFSCFKINWEDKVNNIEEIAKDLNLGLDSFVFLDDSSFEISNMRTRRPEVTSFQVPENIFNYPEFFREQILPLFNLSSLTEDDMERVSRYRTNKKRESMSAHHSSKNDYINSLGLELFVSIEGIEGVARVAQLTSKTNQFNLTTKRYSEGEIASFIENEKMTVISGRVKDRFGDSGKTILAIISQVNENTVEIDTFLMSCRVIGRDIEFAFTDAIVEILKLVGNDRVLARYVKTQKNSQVQNFYNILGFSLEKATEAEREYQLDLSEYVPKLEVNIGINYEK